MSKPRYKPGQHPDYDAALAHFRGMSAVLNVTSYMNEEAWKTSSRGGLMDLLEEYQEKFDKAAELIDGMAQVHEERKLRCRRLGQVEPVTMTPDLLEMKIRQEARADVLLEEIAKIKSMLATWEAREKKEAEGKILSYGPMGSSWGEPCREIDGQPCRADKEGFLHIDCAKSPYDGMLVSDYRVRVSRPWRAARRAEATAARAKAEDVTLPMAERDKWLAVAQKQNRPVPWDELPPRPEGI